MTRATLDQPANVTQRASGDPPASPEASNPHIARDFAKPMTKAEWSDAYAKIKSYGDLDHLVAQLSPQTAADLYHAMVLVDEYVGLTMKDLAGLPAIRAKAVAAGLIEEV